MSSIKVGTPLERAACWYNRKSFNATGLPLRAIEGTEIEEPTKPIGGPNLGLGLSLGLVRASGTRSCIDAKPWPIRPSTWLSRTARALLGIGHCHDDGEVGLGDTADPDLMALLSPIYFAAQYLLPDVSKVALLPPYSASPLSVVLVTTVDKLLGDALKTLVGMVAAGFAALIVLAQATTTEAAEIKVLSANGMREVMEDLGPKFERTTGHRLAITFATLGVIVKRVQDGETADVVAIPRQGIDRLVKEGKADASTVAVLARAGIGVIVRKGAPTPDISTPEALKRALLAAKSITYLDPAAGGTSGVHFAKVLDRLGISAEMKPKTVLHSNARAAAALVANGDAEIGINLIQELMPLPGIELVGPLPGDLQNTLVFAAVVMSDAKDAPAAKALIDFLRTPEAAAVIKAKGMEPG